MLPLFFCIFEMLLQTAGIDTIVTVKANGV